MTDIKSFLLKGLEHLRVLAEEFAGDSLRLIKALRHWAVPFVASYTILAIIPVIFAINIGHLTNAIIGARGVGTMTIDVTGALRTFIIVALLGFASFTFLSRFEGKAKLIGQTFCDLLMLATLFGYLLSLNWWGVAIFTVIFLPIRIILFKIPYLEYVFVIPAVFFFAECASKVINYAVIRAVTVGDAMSTVAASGLLTIVVSVLLLKYGKPSTPHS